MKPRFFKRPADFRAWLERHHATTAELLVGFYKRDSGRPSITWPESVDEALCFGWIDGVRRRIDEASYSIRFTPRRRGSIWSNVNTKRMTELIAQKRVHPAGLKAFDARDPVKTGVYSFERETAAFSPALEKAFRANQTAWRFFDAQPPGYKRIVTFFVVSAKQEATRKRRLERVIALSANGERLDLGKSTTTPPTPPTRL